MIASEHHARREQQVDVADAEGTTQLRWCVQGAEGHAECADPSGRRERDDPVVSDRNVHPDAGPLAHARGEQPAGQHTGSSIEVDERGDFLVGDDARAVAEELDGASQDHGHGRLVTGLGLCSLPHPYQPRHRSLQIEARVEGRRPDFGDLAQQVPLVDLPPRRIGAGSSSRADSSSSPGRVDAPPGSAGPLRAGDLRVASAGRARSARRRDRTPRAEGASARPLHQGSVQTRCSAPLATQSRSASV